jgi:phosphopantothenoylcysteine synthetase/decarboxylase
VTTSFDGRLLTIVVSGAGPATDVHRLVGLAHDHGWVVEVIATPAALGFFDQTAIEAAVGSPVRSQYRSAPGQTRNVPQTAAVLLAPATFNTINKLALGINDTYALNILAEAIGRPLPVVVIPFVNSALAARAPFQRSIQLLREEGVRIVFGPDDSWEPHPPGTGSSRLELFPWALGLDLAEAAVIAHKGE